MIIFAYLEFQTKHCWGSKADGSHAVCPWESVRGCNSNRWVRIEGQDVASNIKPIRVLRSLVKSEIRVWGQGTCIRKLCTSTFNIPGSNSTNSNRLSTATADAPSLYCKVGTLFLKNCEMSIMEREREESRDKSQVFIRCVRSIIASLWKQSITGELTKINACNSHCKQINK